MIETNENLLLVLETLISTLWFVVIPQMIRKATGLENEKQKLNTNKYHEYVINEYLCSTKKYTQLIIKLQFGYFVLSILLLIEYYITKMGLILLLYIIALAILLLTCYWNIINIMGEFPKYGKMSTTKDIDSFLSCFQPDSIDKDKLRELYNETKKFPEKQRKEQLSKFLDGLP